jgi:hypothetical protein
MINRITAHAPSLRTVQRQVAAHILGAPPDAGAAALVPWLALPPGARPEERLAVYAGGYPARLHEALAEQFPALAHLVGPRRFAALVRRYTAAVRLTSYSLNEAGAELPAFLLDDELSGALPFAGDLARLEWAVVRAFHAEEAAPLEAAELADWSLDDWAVATVRVQPSVAVLVSPWPLRALWEARETPIEAIDVDLRSGDQVVVHRAGFAVACTSIPAAEARALSWLLSGASLGAVIERLAEDGTGADELVSWFAGWRAASMIAGLVAI